MLLVIEKVRSLLVVEEARMLLTDEGIAGRGVADFSVTSAVNVVAVDVKVKVLDACDASVCLDSVMGIKVVITATEDTGVIPIVVIQPRSVDDEDNTPDILSE